MPPRSVGPTTPPSDAGSPQTTAAAAVRGPQQEMQTGTRRSGSEPRRDQWQQSPPRGCAGMSSSSGMAVLGVVQSHLISNSDDIQIHISRRSRGIHCRTTPSRTTFETSWRIRPAASELIGYWGATRDRTGWGGRISTTAESCPPRRSSAAACAPAPAIASRSSSRFGSETASILLNSRDG